MDQDDPRVAPLLAELAHEYSSRYGGTFEELHEDLRGYPRERFAPPAGALLLLLEDGTRSPAEPSSGTTRGRRS